MKNLLELKQSKELLQNCRLRKNKISNLEQIDSKDYFYCEFLSMYEEIAITVDIQIFGYEKAIKENQYLAKEYPFIANEFDLWQIGVSGQGDYWFIDRVSQEVLSVHKKIELSTALLGTKRNRICYQTKNFNF